MAIPLIKPISHSRRRQRGTATLLVVLVTLVLLSIMTIYTSRVAVMDQRMSGNEFRYREAFAAAQAGLDATIMAFKRQTTATAINPAAVTLNAAQGVGYDSAISVAGAVFSVSAIGSVTESGSSVAQATLSRQFSLLPGLGGSGVPAPLSIGGTGVIGGNFEIRTNSYGGSSPSVSAGDQCLGNFPPDTSGVPVSVWSGQSASLNGSSDTCRSMTSGSCDTSTLITNHGVVPSDQLNDVVASDPSFPSDLFLRTFGVSKSNYPIIKQNAYVITAAGCASLGSASTGIYWVSGGGTCTPPNSVGTTINPIILVVDDTDLRMNAGDTMNGVIYLFDSDNSGTVGTLQLNGGAQLNGAFISEVAVNNSGGGNFALNYDPCVLDALGQRQAQTTKVPPPNAAILGYIPGSWRDF